MLRANGCNIVGQQLTTLLDLTCCARLHVVGSCCANFETGFFANGRNIVGHPAAVGGGTLGISGWGCAAGTLEPLTYTRASSAELTLY